MPDIESKEEILPKGNFLEKLLLLRAEVSFEYINETWGALPPRREKTRELIFTAIPRTYFRVKF